VAACRLLLAGQKITSHNGSIMETETFLATVLEFFKSIPYDAILYELFRFLAFVTTGFFFTLWAAKEMLKHWDEFRASRRLARVPDQPPPQPPAPQKPRKYEDARYIIVNNEQLPGETFYHGTKRKF
jgi:hypothetical protein